MTRRPKFTMKTRLALVAIGAAAVLAMWWADDLGLLDAHLEAVVGVSSLVSIGLLTWFIIWWRRQT